jgi:predicted aldo/keto reductase-like oxidoreductase
MDDRAMSRRNFLTGTAMTAGTVAAGGTMPGAAQAGKKAKTGAPAVNTSKILNYNPNMEYRRLGRTGLMISAVCMGGHWKRLDTMLGAGFKGMGASESDFENIKNPGFQKNRHQVLTRCMEVGINYVDACSPQEILAYRKALEGRRDKMYFGFSWHTREPRYADWRNGKRLLEGFNQSLKEAGLDYVDVWRISLPQQGIADLGELRQIEEATVEGLERARQQGKARFTGVSTHNRIWLSSVIEEYPNQMQVVLFPYTAATKELPDDSVFEAIKKHDVGVFAIKPFADNALFAGDSSVNSPDAAEDDRRARLAIRYILGNPAITAPIPGMINRHQVDNAAQAVMERRKLDRKEQAELDEASQRMWANLSPSHQWLKDWEYV